MSALATSIAHQTYKRGAGQGPFKHTQSVEHALLGVRKAAEEIQLALGRIDHNAADLDGVRRGNERALLAGLEVLITAAHSTEERARQHLSQLKSGGAPDSASKTVKHRDPRKGIKDILVASAKLANTLRADLQHHQAVLLSHVAHLEQRFADLEVRAHA